MIEILALAVLLVCGGLLAYGVYKFIKHREAKQQEEFDAWIKEVDERALKMREAERQRQANIKVAESYSKPKSYHKSTVTKNSGMPTRTSSSTVSPPADTWSNDLLTTMIIADTITDAVSAFGNTLSSGSSSNSESANSSSDTSSSYSSSPSYSDSSSSSSSYSDSSSSSSSYD